jgi:hypothetical protein
LELRLHYHTDREICATWGPVVIRICDGVRTEIEDLDRVAKVFDEVLTTHKTVAVLLVLTHGTPPLMDIQTQRHAKEAMLRYGNRLLLCGAVLGLGFWASAMRATLSFFMRVAGPNNMWVESSVERAVDRLASELVGIDADGLLVVYQQLWDQLVSRARRAG